MVHAASTDFVSDLSEVGDSASPRERVVRDLIRGLYEGRYKPGQRLIEAQLTATYGISRGPVREALNRLAASGIVVLTPSAAPRCGSCRSRRRSTR